MRDWKTLFVTGRPLYEDSILEASVATGVEMGHEVISSSLTRSSICTQEVSNEQLLNDVDFQEYKVGMYNTRLTF